MTAGEVVDLIKKNLGAWNDRSTRDTFKAGGPDSTVTGIATTMFMTFDVLQRAHAAGLNMIIPHEDTWWNDPDNTKDLQENALYKQKLDFIQKNNIIIFRMHDSQHSQKPDYTVVGLLRAVGIKGGENAVMAPRIWTIPETTFGDLAAQVRRTSGFRAIRCVGDPKTKVSKLLVGPGYATPRFTAEADVVIGGESQEADGGFDNVEYVMDAASLGINKGLIMLGHAVSEQTGLEDFANWLRTFVHDVPIKFVPTEEPYW